MHLFHLYRRPDGVEAPCINEPGIIYVRVEDIQAVLPGKAATSLYLRGPDNQWQVTETAEEVLLACDFNAERL
ncbi:MAG: hypothetical protein ABR532_08925 [Candidatus Dormibacteria bacterium]